MHCQERSGKAYRVILGSHGMTSDYRKYCEVSLVWRIRALSHWTADISDLRRGLDLAVVT